MHFRIQKFLDLRNKIQYTYCVFPSIPGVLGWPTVIKYIDISAVKHMNSYTGEIKKKKRL